MENAIQDGLMKVTYNLVAPAISVAAGLSANAYLGWLVVVHTMGWMTGLKVLLLGVGPFGLIGLSQIGWATANVATAAPAFAIWLDSPAYRKTVPTTIMLIARAKMAAAKE